MRRFVIFALFLGTLGWAQTAPGALQLDPSGWKDIMPDASFAGWTRLPFLTPGPIDAVSQWSVDRNQHVLICEGNRGHEWLRYDKELTDLILHVEFRFKKIPDGKGYNSGVMVRNSADGSIWFQGQAGEEGTGWLFGNAPLGGPAARFNMRANMTENRVKPAGEWNTYEMRAVGPRITLWVNGGVTTEVTNSQALKGYVGLEAEGYYIEFRNIMLKELK